MLQTKKRLAEVSLGYRDIHGLNAQEFNQAKELYHNYEIARNNADWVEDFLSEILEDDYIAEMFDIDPNDDDQVEYFQLLIIHQAMIDTERSNQCFTKYTEFACFPKNIYTR